MEFDSGIGPTWGGGFLGQGQRIYMLVDLPELIHLNDLLEDVTCNIPRGLKSNVILDIGSFCQAQAQLEPSWPGLA